MSVEQGNGSSVASESYTSEELPAPGGRIVRQVEAPPLPETLADGEPDGGSPIPGPVAAGAPTVSPAVLPRPRRLRAGCYLLRYTPTPHAVVALPVHYDGTMRVQRDGANTIASGDLYLHRPLVAHPLLPPREPNPATGIPIFPIRSYRYYVRVTQILEGVTFATQFTLGFELHRFDRATGTWTMEGPFTARMSWTPAPAGFPSAANYLRGTVRNAAGTTVGTLSMGWVSRYLRRATIEIDRVNASEPALANTAGVGWRELFEQVGWDMTVDESDSNVAEPSGASWSNAEMHAVMLARRDSADLDHEWRYWLVCVRELDETPRGIMFDSAGTDSNNIPREGAGQASHWIVPNADPWGLVKGVRFGTATDPYFRTAVHEIGHAMGLYHNTIDNGFMNTTDVIASSAVSPQQFPQNIQWSHAPDDQKRLRHMPDIWVRPGGIAFGQAFSTAPISPDDAVLEPDGLQLDVGALQTTVPIGAPVRVDIALRNTGPYALDAPADLSLGAGYVSGSVTDPSGTVRTFRSVVRCVEEQRLAQLDENGGVGGSLTLLRGPEGPLFPLAGAYTVHVDVEWELDGLPLKVGGDGAVMVTPPVNDAHAEAALRVFSSPDALLTLAIGGDHLTDGVAAIEAALGDDALRPHYAFVEAKRVATPFFDRPPDLARAAELIDAGCVMSAAEVGKASRLLAAAKRSGEAPPDELVGTLREKADATGADEAMRTLEAL